MCPLKKLLERYLGPFEVTDRLGSHSYWINLPEHLQAIHPVFYISQLELVLTSQIPNCTDLFPLSIELDGVLDFKLANQRKDPLLYYVHWLGYEGSAEEYSWLTMANLKNTTKLVAEFHCHYPNKLGSSFTPILTSPYNLGSKPMNVEWFITNHRSQGMTLC